MNTNKGQVAELLLQNGFRQVRISCATNLIPSAGQYLLAGSASTDPLPVPLFYTDSSPEGFMTSLPMPFSWNPGQEIYLRGPLGHGFTLPISAGKVALIAFGGSFVRLNALIAQSLKQGAAVVLVCDMDAPGLPDDVEVQPLSALEDVTQWADYVAFDVERGNLPGLRERFGGQSQTSLKSVAHVLIHAPMPCGGVAECGVCSVLLKSGWKLTCKDGPVFDLREI